MKTIDWWLLRVAEACVVFAALLVIAVLLDVYF